MIQIKSSEEIQIAEIKLACEQYITHVLSLFEEKLKKKNNVAYQYYYQHNFLTDKKEIADQIAKFEFKESNWITKDEELLLRLLQYIVAKDIYRTLSSEKAYSYKEELFIAKLNHHKDLLQQNLDFTSYQFIKLANKFLGAKRFLEWLWWLPKKPIDTKKLNFFTPKNKKTNQDEKKSELDFLEPWGLTPLKPFPHT